MFVKERLFAPERYELQVVEGGSEWKLDDHTVKIGRAGLRNARQALHQARPTDTASESKAA